MEGDGGRTKMVVFENLTESILQGNESKVREIVEQSMKRNVSVKDILNNGLIESMNMIGVKFKKGELFIPEVLRAAKAMKAGIEVIRPLFDKSGVELLGKVVIGTVKGDLHDIGKNLVSMMVEGGGFEVIDIGIDAPPEKFVERIKASGAKLCMMSALLTTTMPVMKTTIEALQKAGLRGVVKTMVGGAPVTQKFADDIGADGYGSNAADAVEVAKRLITD
jgi:5-methyltetrahydrofolate--homocysteine methyltransferase